MKEKSSVNDYMNRPIPELKALDWAEVAAQDLEDCGEELVPASLIPEKVLVRPQYFIQGLKSAAPECYVRRGVLSRLIDAASRLPRGYKLVLLDAWRPVELQQELFDMFVDELRVDFPGKTDRQIKMLALNFVALPSSDSQNPSPHSTGGAVDLSIADADGVLLNMGTEFDDTSDRSFTRYFEERLQNGSKPGETELEALRNRRLLFHVMIEAGFTNFPNEWWHFDYGDKVWACMKPGADRGKAVYGSTSIKARWRKQAARLERTVNNHNEMRA